ncbi:hypothetical protein AB0L40_12210 [Patulibacter sp. NPDC049589]|uniref:hypothetical protein n=1 Tax=Patulibacter sp. NPDC049589 TaxID=3154731 RepID=UPI0034306EB5
MSPASVRSLVLPLALAGLAALPCTALAASDPDGKYRGALTADNVVDGGPVNFDVASNGTRIKRWRVTMNVTCASYPVKVELITQTMPTMKVARNGTFRSVFTGPVQKIDDVRIVVSGRLKGRRVTQGRISYDVGFRSGRCTRTAAWTAKVR